MKEPEDCAAEGGCDEAMPPVPLARWRVRTRRLVGNASDVYQLLVQCPVRGATALAECEACPYFRSVSLDATGHRSYASCSFPGGEPSAHAAPGDARAQAHVRLSAIASDPVCARPDLSTRRLGEVFSELGIGGAPVVDDDGRPVGVVSKTDLVRHPSAATVAEVLTPEVHALAETASVAEAAELMSRRKVHRIVVLSPDGRVSGVVSSLDVTQWLSRRRPRYEPAGYRLRPED